MIDKNKLLDSRGRPLTQSLFLECGYNTELAVYTLKEYDYEYEGKTYPSLKQLYLAHEDPVEYDFANTYLYSWDQWEKICNNRQTAPHTAQWRIELELKLSSQAVRDIVLMTDDEKSFQARKYVAERGWNKNRVGRPRKDTSAHDEAVEKGLNEDFDRDWGRVVSIRGD